MLSEAEDKMVPPLPLERLNGLAAESHFSTDGRMGILFIYLFYHLPHLSP